MAWGFPGEADEYADRVLSWLDHGIAVVPRLWPFELANSLLVGERRSRILLADAAIFIQRLGSLAISIDDADAWPVERLLTIGHQHGTSAYDAAYLELALRRGLPLATLDRHLGEAAQHMGIALFDPR